MYIHGHFFLIRYHFIITTTVCDGMSGASLADVVCWAAASRALERAVEGLTTRTTTDVDDCLIALDDFDQAIKRKRRVRTSRSQKRNRMKQMRATW